MEISALGFLLVLASTGLLAVSNPGSRRELDADIHGMQDGYFMDSPGGWRMDNDEDPWTHWGDNGYLSGATNLVAYSDSKPSIENVQPSFEHHLQDSKPSIEKVQPSFEHHLQIDIMLFKIYDEVKMFELVELEPNSTESRCLDCCTPTPYDPKRPIMRREERASTRDQPLQNAELAEDMTKGLVNGGFRSSKEVRREWRPAVAVLPGLHSPINTEVDKEQEQMVSDHTTIMRLKREVTGGSPPPRRRTRPPQPDCTGCYSSLNLQSDPGSSSDPEGSE